MSKIYLDFAATTPCDPRVVDVMKDYWNRKFGNPSSIHSYGREARAALDESREIISSAINAHPSEIYFVSGGTEADNCALKGLAAEMMKHGKNHIITSAIEHPAILETCSYLEKHGFKVTYLPVDGNGCTDPENIRREITGKTGLISIMHVNNEIGVINPLEEISRITKAQDIIFHTDAVQSFGKIPVDVNQLGVDSLSISAHKIYGPKGIGAVYLRRGASIEKLIHGGGQERGRRAGTESVPLAAGFAEAVKLIAEHKTQSSNLISSLRDKCEILLGERFPQIIINSKRDNAVPHILNFSFDSSKIEIDGEAILYNLDLAGIAVTSGSACGSGTLKPSPVLLAMGKDESTARASIRISFGRITENEEIKEFIERLSEIVSRIGKKRM
ncbi:MAG: cysteine desulfurase NifS [Chlorobiaceae bacterium]|nr:cysteine desulfurase NifS [Chlorobiaceae bacterium]